MLDLLKNIGTALYIHKKLQKVAEQAKKSVDYFSKFGMFRQAVSQDHPAIVKK